MIYSSQTEMKRPICYATANNEIDSDYFAVVSECESYGQETDAELSITEFALRAAGYVDALVESLEKALQRIAELDKDCRVYENNVKNLLERAGSAESSCAEAARILQSGERMALTRAITILQGPASHIVTAALNQMKLTYDQINHNQRARPLASRCCNRVRFHQTENDYEA
nr:hypothetical protein [Klebsiella pneumoniae subsp. pneumoniae]